MSLGSLREDVTNQSGPPDLPKPSAMAEDADDAMEGSVHLQLGELLQVGLHHEGEPWGGGEGRHRSDTGMGAGGGGRAGETPEFLGKGEGGVG